MHGEIKKKKKKKKRDESNQRREEEGERSRIIEEGLGSSAISF